MELIELTKEISSVCIILASIAGGIAVLVKILNRYSEHKAFEQRCNAYRGEIDSINTQVKNAHTFASEAIEQMQSETDAKLQEIRSEQEMITYCMRAVLDGLHQLNCNGPVTEASEKLDIYLNSQAHR